MLLQCCMYGERIKCGFLTIACLLLYFKKKIIYLFLERGREGDKEGEKHPCVVASCMPPTQDLARNPGMCPDWESNGDPLIHRPALNLLSHSSQGCYTLFLSKLSLSNYFSHMSITMKTQLNFYFNVFMENIEKKTCRNQYLIL